MSTRFLRNPEDSSNGGGAPAPVDAGGDDDGGMSDLARRAYEKGMNAAYARMRREGQLRASDERPAPAAEPPLHPLEAKRRARAEQILAELEQQDYVATRFRVGVQHALDRAKPAASTPTTAPTGGSSLEQMVALLVADKVEAMQQRQLAAQAEAAAKAAAAVSPVATANTEYQAAIAAGRSPVEAARETMQGTLGRTKVTVTPSTPALGPTPGGKLGR